MIDFMFVNYHPDEFPFMEAQAKIFKLCNPTHNYRVIVADGTGFTSHEENLKCLRDEGFIDELIVYRSTPKNPDYGWDGSAQHGEGLEIAFASATSSIVCPQDPDHFWVGKDFCNVAEHLMASHVAVGVGTNFQCSSPPDRLLRNLKGQDDEESKGRLRHPSGLVTLMGGAFIRTSTIRDNRLTWEFSMPLYQKASYDTGFLIVNYLEKNHPDEILWLRPRRIEWDNRLVNFATICDLNEKPFALHMKAGSAVGDHPVIHQMKQLRPRFIDYALQIAERNCGN